MDNTITLYLIKASIAFALFYVLYMLFLKKDTFFKIRRVCFLFAIAFSLLFPVFTIEMPMLQQEEAEAPVYMYWLSEIEIGEMVVEPVMQPSLNFWHLLGLIAVSVSVFLLFRLVLQLFSVVRLKVSSESRKVSLFHIVELKNKEVSPFSFFNWIFVNPELQDEKKLNEIIVHEQVHVRQLHSIDVVLFEVLCVCFWWNPFVWLLRNEMRLNLEYLADQGVLESGFNTKDYQYVLLQTTNKNTGIPMINNFNVSQLKKRITMMNKERTSMYRMVKYLLVLPLVAVLLLGNSVQASSDVKKMITDELYDNVTPPEFPGGEDAKNRFFVNKLKYPVEAQEAGIEDRVVAKIVVSQSGEIKNIEITSNSNELLNNEMIRVIKEMPKWTPGEKDGKATESEAYLSCVFRFNKENTKGVKAEAGDMVVVGFGKSTTMAKETESRLQDDKPISMAEQMPRFPGGYDAMSKFIMDSLRYPVEVHKTGVSGRVTIRFVVSKTGEIKDAEVIRGFDPACDREALRVVNAMPNWEPGKQKGKEVDVYFTLPIIFRLTKDNKVEDHVLILDGKEIAKEALAKEVGKRTADLKKEGREKELIQTEVVLTEAQAQVKYGSKYKGKQVVEVSFSVKE